MRKQEDRYKNFLGDTAQTMSVDLDVDNTSDFVNVSGIGGIDDIDEQFQLALDETAPTFFDDGSYSFDFNPNATYYGAPETDEEGYVKPITNLTNKQDVKPAPRANKGQGLGTFAQGLAKGLGLFDTGLQNPQGTAQTNNTGTGTTIQQGGFTTEKRNPWIPLLIGGIGVAVVVFAVNAINKKKVATTTATTAPTPPNLNA